MSTFIEKCRKEIGLTQPQLAEKLNVSTTAVQNWENGRTRINMARYIRLAEIFNISVDNLIKEMIIEEDKRRPDNWPDFLFDEETNKIVDTLHLNLAQQDLFGLLYIYDAEYLGKQNIDIDIFKPDLKNIPYGFIDKIGSIQFINQAECLHKVIKYIQTDFLMKVLKQNPESEFNIRKLSKDLICEFIDTGYKYVDTFFYSELDEGFEGVDYLNFPISMKSARIILPLLDHNGPVHLTDGKWSNSIREDIPQDVLSGILEMCDFRPDLFAKGYYKDKYTTSYIRDGLDTVTDYKNISTKDKEECWMWSINDKGRKLLEWFNE